MMNQLTSNRPFGLWVYSGARVFGHCVCILCTLLSLSSCEKPINDDSVVSGSVADKNLRITVFSIEKTPFEALTRADNAKADFGKATPASEACTRLNFAVYTLDVSIEKNYITWVSGSFFGGSGSDPTGGAGITSVTVNTDWAGETHVTF